MRDSGCTLTSFKGPSITRYSNKTGHFRARNLWPIEIFAALVRACLAVRARREDAGCCGNCLSEPGLREGNVERCVTDSDTDSWKKTAKAMNPDLREFGHDAALACCPSATQSRILLLATSGRASPMDDNVPFRSAARRGEEHRGDIGDDAVRCLADVNRFRELRYPVAVRRTRVPRSSGGGGLAHVPGGVQVNTVCVRIAQSRLAGSRSTPMILVG